MSTAFGAGYGTQQQQQQQQQPQTTGFGNTGTTGGLFGTNPQQQQTGFGAGTFGQPPATGTGLFGTKPTGTGLFGNAPTASTTGGGLFGTQTQSTPGFGTTAGNTGFGTQNPSSGGGLFGPTAANTSSSLSTGNPGFGNQQAQTGFGTTQGTGGGLFGTQGNTTASPFGPTQPAAGSNTFGGGFSTAQTQPQQTPFGIGFGNNQQQQLQQNKPFGGFGTQNPTAPTSLFGNTQQQPAQGGGLFGNKPGFGANTTPATGPGLFGTNPAPNATAGGLFGTTQQTPSATGGLFGNTQQTQQPQSGGLFGNNKPAGGLFGSTATPAASNTGGLFGQQQQPGGVFGGNQQQQQPGGLFNSSAMNNPQGQYFTSSISDPNPYGPNSLLGASVQGSPGPLATPIASIQKKKAAMLPQSKIAPRMSQVTPRLGASFSRSGTPFASSSSGGTPLASSTLSKSLSSSTSKLHLFDNDDTVLSAGAFTPSAGSRVASLKRLVIDRNIRDADLFTGGSDLKGVSNGKEDGRPKGILKKAVSFDADNNNGRNHVDLFGRDEGQSNNGRQAHPGSPDVDDLGYMRSPASKAHRDSGDHDVAADTTVDEIIIQGNEVAVIGEASRSSEDSGSYWMVPSLATLKSLPREKLKHVTNLTVGRKGYGQVRFEPAVDLTNIPPEDIMDGIVVFQSRVCTVYPEHLPKPPPGMGLNVPSIISLEDCFPQYKDTRGPVKDPEHPRYIAHLNRLKSIKDTEFIDYVAAEGIWIFRVQHFTTYGLVDSDDDDEQDGSYDEDSTPRQSSYYDQSSMLGEHSFSFDGDADVSGIASELASDSSSAMDDTFEFRKRRSSVASTVVSPGMYAGDGSIEESYEEGSTTEENTSTEMQDQEVSFLGEGSTGSTEEDEEEEDLDETEESVELDHTQELDESVLTASGNARDVLSTPIPSPMKKSIGQTTGITPKSLPMAKNWTEQLNMTISPVKRRAKMILMSPVRAKPFDFTPQKGPAQHKISGPLNYGHLDIMNDLFSGTMEGVGRFGESMSPVKERQFQEV